MFAQAKRVSRLYRSVGFFLKALCIAYFLQKHSILRKNCYYLYMASQLLHLKITNYRSIYSEQTIDFCFNGKTRAVTAMYGPNAGGKSNIAWALRFIQFFIRNSSSANLTSIAQDPFLLKDTSSSQPSTFEIALKQGKKRFMYGFSITGEAVVHEYLKEYAGSTKKLRIIFERVQGKLNPSAEKFKFGRKLHAKTRQGTLLITKAYEDNNEYAAAIFEWLENLNILSGMTNETIQWSIQQLKENTQLQAAVLELMNNADLSIRRFKLEEIILLQKAIDHLPLNTDFKKYISTAESVYTIKTIHAVRDRNQKIVSEETFDLSNQESSGTQKFFELAAPILNTLADGKVLYIDEFGAFLHSDLSQFIVTLFTSHNPNHAQLIINTHDTSLMTQDGPLAREDILFVEKNAADETIITPLAKKSARSNESFEKRYREGLYGAKPKIETTK